MDSDAKQAVINAVGRGGPQVADDYYALFWVVVVVVTTLFAGLAAVGMLKSLRGSDVDPGVLGWRTLLQIYIVVLVLLLAAKSSVIG